MSNKRRIPYKAIYVIVDIIIAFGVSMFAFLSFYKPNGFIENNHWLLSLIYSGCIAIITPIVFFIFKIYKIITIQFSIIDAIRIMVVTLLIQLVGLIVISFVPILPRFTEYIFAWALSTVTLLFLYPFLRLLVRLSNIAGVVSKKENQVRTIVIGAGATGKVVVDESRRNKDNHNHVVAMVDDDPNKIGGLFANIPVIC